MAIRNVSSYGAVGNGTAALTGTYTAVNNVTGTRAAGVLVTGAPALTAAPANGATTGPAAPSSWPTLNVSGITVNGVQAK